MLSSSAFQHRNKTKKQITEESQDRLKHKMIDIDAFTDVRKALREIGTDGVNKYKLSHSKKAPNYGRLYDVSYRLMGYMNNSVRSVGLNGMVEIHQKACHPTNFKRLYLEMFGKTPKASAFLVDRKEDFIESALRFYQLEKNDETLRLIKSIICSVTYGGGIGSVFEDGKYSALKPQFKDSNNDFVMSPELEGYKAEVN